MVLTQDPIRFLDVKQVWLWDEWPDYPGRDIGIDLVAELFDRSLCAIQAKCFDENRDIPKSELDRFISAASQHTFQQRWLIATTDKLSANARSKQVLLACPNSTWSNLTLAITNRSAH
jgi:predicted helicase